MARRKAAATSKPPRRGPLRWIGSLIRILTAVTLGYLLACTLLLLAYRVVLPPATTVQLQRAVEAAVTQTPYDFQYRPVSEEAQDADVRHAAVASEDARFYTHGGFDMEELRRAREDAERTGRPMRGASTLTQQLVKNLFLTTHRSIVRKALEIPLTLLAEWILPKERILTLYLDVAEWGPGVFGIEAAAQYHYGTSASALTREQAARLVACLPAPLERRPQDMGRTSSRILTRMRQMGW
ncbi:MAG: monofunctional biosynthetic peptidoglycan transglycosylase [Rhodothermaceae bacterium]|nr:monofunctional biosynthetic peptidoglycan transglycosylase [Rhodothermaceae bacterium]